MFRSGAKGFSEDLDKVMRTHIRQTARYVIETGRPTVPMQVNMILMQLELAGVIDAMQVPATVGRELAPPH